VTHPDPTTSMPLPRPIAELHLHLEGTLEPELIFELAARNERTLPYADLADLRSRYRFTDLQSFLDLYYANMATLRTEADFTSMTWRYLVRAHAAGVRHAEVFVDPQAHTTRGVSVADVLHGVQAGLDRAAAELDLTSGIIVCVLRDRPVAEALTMLEDALAVGVPILGIGLDSAEVGHPPEAFAGVFVTAAEAGLRRVAHAGEEGPPKYIWAALDVLGAERIDHGVRCLEDAALVDRLARDRVPLTVCPLSNVRLRVVPQMSEHPLPRMLDRGLMVTVNSDDPAYFGGYVDDNYAALRADLGLSDKVLGALAANSIASSFAPDERKAALLSAGDICQST
jgi:adenosine deaminase